MVETGRFAQTTERGRAVAATWVGLAIALLLAPILSYAVPTALSVVPRVLLREAGFWTCAAAVVLIVVRAERRPLASIGIKKPTWASLLRGVVAFLVLSAAYGVVTELQRAAGMPDAKQELPTLLALPLWLRLLMVARAGVVEEVLYRGYPIERIAWMSGSTWLGALVPLVVFSLLHVPFWGVRHLPVVVVASVVLTLLYVWKRDLSSNMVAHFLTDLVGIIVVPLMQAPRLP
jgi:membrane protease YdiL (CAAX protease family)